MTCEAAHSAGMKAGWGLSLREETPGLAKVIVPVHVRAECPKREEEEEKENKKTTQSIHISRMPVRVDFWYPLC